MTLSMAQSGLISQVKPGVSDNLNNLSSQCTRLYIQNLPAYLETNRLREHFASKGEVTDAIVVKTKDGSKSRRFGFIGYKTHEQAKIAKEFFHQSFLDTCKINVQYAVAKTADEIPRPWSKYSAGSSRFEASKNASKNIPETKKEVKETPSITKDCSTKEEDSAEFKEFMETMQARSKTRFWANDDGGLDDSNKKKEMSKILNDDSEEEDGDEEEEEYQDLDTIVKKKLNETQNKKEMMSDMDFLRSKMKQNLAEEDQEEVEEEEQEQEQEEEEEQEEEDQVSSFKPSPRLFVGNLPYTTVEEDLLDLFNQFGEVVEVHMPLDDTKRRKGFGFVLFKNPVDAQTAMNGLNGFSFQGRVLHVVPSRKSPQESQAVQQETLQSTYKQKKEMERQQNANTKNGWNASFIRSDATIGSLAERMGVQRGEILNKEYGNMAIRLAIGETMLVKENKLFFAKEGIDLDAIENVIKSKSTTTTKTKIERSCHVILIKNLPHTTKEEELFQLFGKFGDIGRFLLAPSKTLALVEFLEPSEARKAFRSLAYKKYQHVPLYLEWAPLKVFTTKTTAAKAADATAANANITKTQEANALLEGSLEQEEDTTSTTLCIKNLNFTTTGSTLEKLFRQSGSKIRKVTIATKNDDGRKTHKNKVLSRGFGFIEFHSHQDALNAIKSFQSTVVDGHKIQLNLSSSSHTTTGSTTTNNNKRQLPMSMPTKKQTTKLIVRNVAFEATIHEIRQLFGTFGQLKKVRMPKKFDGKHRGFAFVEFLTEQEALNAFNSLRNSHLYGRHLVLEWATTTTKEEEQEQEQALEVLRIKAKKDYQSLKREEKRLRLTTSYTNEDKSKYDEDM